MYAHRTGQAHFLLDNWLNILCVTGLRRLENLGAVNERSPEQSGSGPNQVNVLLLPSVRSGASELHAGLCRLPELKSSLEARWHGEITLLEEIRPSICNQF